jgi:hypothetical protein
MKRPFFTSAFNPLINEYLDFRREVGVNPARDYTYLQKLDSFLLSKNCAMGEFSLAMAMEWRQQRKAETRHGHYLRIGVSRRFFEYLFTHGHPVALFRNVKPPTPNYVPHVYTEDEITKYFAVVDTCKISLYINKVQCLLRMEEAETAQVNLMLNNIPAITQG